jgi:hypothetical protein
MDDAFEGQPAGRGQDGIAKMDGTGSGNLLEWLQTCLALDRAGYALRDQQPPGNDVSVPRIDDDFNVLVQKVTFDNADVHEKLAVRHPQEAGSYTLSAAQSAGASVAGAQPAPIV